MVTLALASPSDKPKLKNSKITHPNCWQTNNFTNFGTREGTKKIKVRIYFNVKFSWDSYICLILPQSPLKVSEKVQDSITIKCYKSG